MPVSPTFEEIRVYGGVAERTGVQFDRGAVRHSDGCCRSLSQLTRKARGSGDGYYYLPAGIWPADTEKVEVRKPWVVASSLDPSQVAE